MKIGFSFGRCLRDIVLKKVDINDVVVIVCRTCMENTEHLDEVLLAYFYPSHVLFGLDQEECKKTAYSLWYLGRLHQPRIFNCMTFSVSDDYVWMDLFPTVAEADENVKKAWENYRMVLKLVTERIPS